MEPMESSYPMMCREAKATKSCEKRKKVYQSYVFLSFFELSQSTSWFGESVTVIVNLEFQDRMQV